MLYLVVGKSGSGKDTIIRTYCKMYNTKCVNSYTTRNPRSENDFHIFVNSEQFNEIRNDLVAYTLFDGNEYGATKQQCEESDFYIIDWDGIEYFKQRCNIPFEIVYINASEDLRYNRMILRGDSEEQAKQRINYDEVKFSGVSMNDIDIVIPNNGTVLESIIKLNKYLLTK